ncbi:MAG: CHASE3 domain-containing protein [Vampirovibrionales bacterium]|nr:CHASE3 domain-containing protein [Vampirovibrionales bacterium]
MKKEISWIIWVSFLIMSLIGFGFIQGAVQEDAAYQQAERSQNINMALERLISELKDIETGIRGYIITGNYSYLEPYNSSLPNINKYDLMLENLIIDPTQTKNLPRLIKLTKKRLRISALSLKLMQTKGKDAAFNQVSTGDGKLVMDAIRAHVAKMQSRENYLAHAAKKKSIDAKKLQRMVYAIGFVIMAALQALAFYRMNQEINQRQMAQKTLEELNESLEIRILEKTREVTELNETLELKVEERTAQLNAVNKELETFSYSVSHDLRSPLRSISGFSQALIRLKNDQLDEEAQDFLNRILNNAQRMGLLIDDLLKLSRLSRGSLQKEPVNLSVLVKDSLDELMLQEQSRQVKVTIEPDLIATADKQLIDAALQNLINNAWKYTSKNEIAEISFGSRMSNDKQAFYIQDNGAGFNMKYAHKLFGAFQRLHAMEEFSGNGIGLATVQRIIHRHGGEVWAEAEEGKGATFYFTL